MSSTPDPATTMAGRAIILAAVSLLLNAATSVGMCTPDPSSEHRVLSLSQPMQLTCTGLADTPIDLPPGEAAPVPAAVSIVGARSVVSRSKPEYPVLHAGGAPMHALPGHGSLWNRTGRRETPGEQFWSHAPRPWFLIANLRTWVRVGAAD